MRRAAERYALDQRGRRRQDRRDVVEPVAGVVYRQPFSRFEVDVQKIADGVAVFGAVQPMHRRAARVRVVHRRAIQIRFKERRECLGGRGVRSGANGQRRHFAGADLSYHPFPDLRVAGDIRQRQALQREPSRFQPIVVAADAILVDDGGVRR